MSLRPSLLAVFIVCTLSTSVTAAESDGGPADRLITTMSAQLQRLNSVRFESTTVTEYTPKGLKDQEASQPKLTSTLNVSTDAGRFRFDATYQDFQTGRTLSNSHLHDGRKYQ